MSARSRALQVDQRPSKAETVQTLTSFDQLIPVLIARGLPVQFGLVEDRITHGLRFLAAVGPVAIPVDLVDADRDLWLAIADAVRARFPETVPATDVFDPAALDAALDSFHAANSTTY
jgi:hypothetical protein